ncbi:MAG TPA: FHA domain-containing protein [Anaerolineales bacterium]|nr:FHA domain-containing protein [Anaerolineales bacterium]
MERSGAELPVLIAQTGPLNGSRWLIERAMVVGRDSSCDVVIPDRQVSRFHSRLSPSEKGVLLEDMGSKNGTFHNGNRIEDPTLLSDGDLIQVSLIQHFVFLSSDATMPLEYEISIHPRGDKGRLYLDTRSRRVWVKNKEIIPPLSVPQFRLLQYLYDHQSQVVQRQDLINAIWGEDEAIGVSEQAFDALVRRLRDRLAMVDTTHVFIVTVRGHGLRLDNPQD